MKLSIITPTLLPGQLEKTLPDWQRLAAGDFQTVVIDNGGLHGLVVEHAMDGLLIDHLVTNEFTVGPTRAYEQGRAVASGDIHGYIHDDVTIYEQGWDTRVLAEFDDPAVGVVGFGGGTIHGAPELYKTPYKLTQLARFGYRSNTDDAETHGQRFTGACDVAVLDGYAMFARRELLEKCEGWPTDALPFHVYDYWLCCVAHRYGYRVRVVGVRCQHGGGQSSTTPIHQDWAAKLGTSDQGLHTDGHRWLYDNFRDVLPWRVLEER